MTILTGLFDHCVLQRTNRNQSDAAVTGTCEAAGPLLVTVTKGGRAVSGWNRRQLAVARRGSFAFRLAGLPVGGPYRVRLELNRQRLTVNDVLVGDVWLCAGQSNMQGAGRIQHAARSHPQVRAFYMDDRWATAHDAIHNMWACVDVVHIDLCGGVRPLRNTTHGVGPAVGFGVELQRRTGIPQGLIACAHGGTSMQQWDPARRDEGGKSLYGAMIRRLRKNGGRVAGMIWYQGESEANAEAAPLYTKRMKHFIAAVRRDTRDPRLPVAIVQISRVVGWDLAIAAPWNSVQDQQRSLARSIPRFTTVPAIDLALNDLIHIGIDNNRLGRRLAQAVDALRGGRHAGPPPIQFRDARVERDPLSNTTDIVVRFEHVAGRLTAGSRPTGFSVRHADRVLDCIYDTVLEGNQVRLRTTLPPEGDGGVQLHYGLGAAPYCNIVDQLDRSLPVLGPVHVGTPRAITEFVQRLRVTAPIVGNGTPPALDYATHQAGLAWQVREFPTRFCDLHAELAAPAAHQAVVFFGCALEVAEPMKLAALVGYDGPVKVWLDGRQVFDDPKGTNPAVVDAARLKVDLPAGRHEWVVGLDSNQGRAWGIFLRFERLDVPKRLILQGREHYRLPVIKAEG